MLRTLRNRLILSHILPLLIIIPLTGVAIIYVLETQVLLPSLAKELAGEARLLAEIARNQPQAWENPTFAQDILTQVAAATGAMKKVGRIIVQTYLEECLDRTRKESGTKKGETFRDLQMAISRYINWA